MKIKLLPLLCAVFVALAVRAEDSDTIGQKYFPGGDLIEIKSVERSPDSMVVKGEYNLVSQDSALLALYITATNSAQAITRTGENQTINIAKGHGEFELIHPHPVPGLPHVSMYGGDHHPFATVYFGTKEEAAAEGNMNLSSVAPAHDIDSAPPVVIKTIPEAGRNDVSPGEYEVQVTFSKDMADQSWSWSTAWENSAPEMIGRPHYEPDHRTCIVKVKLEPGTTYGWWLNSQKFHGFRDTQGHAAVPYLMSFGTAGEMQTAKVENEAAQASTPENLKTGLVGLWSGEDSTIDSVSGSKAVNENVTYTDGMVGRAFAFSPDKFTYGTYTGVKVTDRPEFELTKAMTITGWIRVRGTGYMIFWRGDNRPGLDPYSLSMQGNHDLRFTICNENGLSAMVDADIPYDEWIHIAATLDRNTGYSRLRLYTNAVLAAEAKTDLRPFGELQSGASPGVGIGNVNDGGNTFPFLGDIDELALYNRGLSADEVRTLYNRRDQLEPDVSAAQKDPAIPVDLSSEYTTTASQFDQLTDFPAWKSVPRGTQVFDQVPLQIGGMFCLWGEGCAQGKPPFVFPEATTGIRINRKFETLYIYHGSFYASPEGTPVCDVVFHYEDGSTVTNQMLYGEDFLDWRANVKGGTPISPAGSNSRLAWVGGSFSPGKIEPVCFCLTAIENPRPQLPVVSVDLYSRKSRTAAVIMAMTTGPSGLIQEKSAVRPESANNFGPKSAAQAWLALMDAGDYPQSWETAADSFHTAVTKNDWVKLSQKVREPLGKLISRKEISTQTNASMPGLPDGLYFIAQLETSFAALPGAVETVTLARQTDGQWKVISYLIRPRTAEQTAAVTAAQAWLAGIDAGNYAQSWTDAAEFFQGAITQDKWVAAMESVRKPLGKMAVRTVDSEETKTELPGAPDGKYVVMQFKTAYADKSSATETVTVEQDKDGNWKADGYYIK
ncbi:MAG TPA: DUF4019 domain-containing protein [Candidatus Sulfotelmatobacter sp.]|nr:DUF4019 domain-containing protein [Candidatus Sulfotelmatobacter sp.]